jgi:hypothetical protein
MQVFQKLAEYRYEQLVFCHDKATGLRAIIAIHDTTLGPALGGCRMYPYASEDEAVVDVLRLARGMTYKAAASGLNLGGGKSVIIGDPEHYKSEELFRSFGRYLETLGGRYIVAEDVGTSTEDMENIRIETSHVVGVDVTHGGSGDPSPFTALGVLQGMKACAEEVFGSPSLEGRTVAVQGLGHVGWHLCEMLHNEGASLFVTDLREEVRGEAGWAGRDPLYPLRHTRPLRSGRRRQRHLAAEPPLLRYCRQRKQHPLRTPPRRGARRARAPLRPRLRHKRRRPHKRRRRARGLQREAGHQARYAYLRIHEEHHRHRQP